MSRLVFLKRNGRSIFFILLFLFSLYSAYIYLTVGQMGHDNVLVSLSGEFLKKNVALPVLNLPLRDISNYFNNYYVYFGPLSSIILMPFVLLFGIYFPQASIGVSSMIVSFVAVYIISREFRFSSLDALWLSLFFIFSTVLFSSSVINITAYQVEVLGVPLILLAILTYLKKRNPFLIGLFIGLAVMTRVTLIFGVIFFFTELLQKRLSIKQFLVILIPVIAALLLLGAYNNRRFHSFFETGYGYILKDNDSPILTNLKYGEMSLMHLPANLYSFLAMPPLPLLEDRGGGFLLKFPYLKANPWGMAIWYTSPLFLLVILNFKKGIYTISSITASVVIALPLFLWYSIGYAQFGYRYALDFLPFLFLVLLPSLSPKLSKTAIALIVVGVIFNCIYIDSIWESYPVINTFPK